MSNVDFDLTNLGPENTLRRARSALGRGVRYVLGKGGLDPSQDIDSASDCSGFVAWALGIPRRLPHDAWLSTDEYWSGGPSTAQQLFIRVPWGVARPADLYVYPDRNENGKHREGHVCVITDVQSGVPTRIIHCSLGNDRKHMDAIQETTPDMFLQQPASRIMRVDYNALREAFRESRGPSLFIRIPDTNSPDRQFTDHAILGARFNNDHFEVRPSELAPLFRISDERNDYMPLREILNGWEMFFEVNMDAIADEKDPRVYVLI